MANQMQTILKMMAAGTGVNWVSGDYRVALSSSATIPSADGTIYLSAMTNELTGGNYVRKAVTNKSVVEDTSAKCAKLMADNITWTALNAGTIATVWLYLYNASDAAAAVVGVFDPADLATNGGNVTQQWDGQASNGRVATI